MSPSGPIIIIAQTKLLVSFLFLFSARQPVLERGEYFRFIHVVKGWKECGPS
jgi:hypothetical protein